MDPGKWPSPDGPTPRSAWDEHGDFLERLRDSYAEMQRQAAESGIAFGWQPPGLEPGRDPWADLQQYTADRRINAVTHAAGIPPIRPQALNNAAIFPPHVRAAGAAPFEIMLEMSPIAAGRDFLTGWELHRRAQQAHDPAGMALGAGTMLLAAAGMAPGVGSAGRGAKLSMGLASRLARADTMGFQRNMTATIGTSPAGERVAAAAIRTKDGKIYTGQSHADAAMAFENAIGREIDPLKDLSPMGQGFVTTEGRYVSRWEAKEIAKHTAQDKNTPGPNLFRAFQGMVSDDLIPPGTAVQTGPHIATTAPGLPGIEGTWGRLNSPPRGTTASPRPGAKTTPTTATVEAWPRASNLGQMNARGLQEYEIQATLENAWKNGHDAVLMTNYVRPGGRKRETVIVTRDPSQWRRPDATFDPAKKDSWDLTAGLVPLATSGGIIWMTPEDAQGK